jgi:hypothetical protein
MMVDGAQERALEVLRWLLPQGIIDDGWIRVRDIVPHFDIAAQAGIPPSKSEAVVRRLQAAGCLEIDGADMLIAEKQVLDAYASYLALKREYQPTLDDDAQAGDAAAHPGRAMRSLMHALRLSENEIEARQADIRGKYERYRELQLRFKDFDKLK